MIIECLNNSQQRLKDLIKENVVVGNFVDNFCGHTIKEIVDKLEIGKEIGINKTKMSRHWISNDKRLRIINETNNWIQAQKILDYNYGDMNKWSFVFITQGKRDNVLIEGIGAIKNQQIIDYEIIVIGGPVKKDYGEGVIHVPFMQFDDKGWITRKKNLGCEMAKFENLCVMHDDMILCDDWFEKMSDWGNNWEFCNLSIVSHPTLSWFAEKGSKNVVIPVGGYDNDLYVGGHCIVIKKFVWEQVKWDEKLFWGQREDVIYSWALRDKGFLLRVCSAEVRLK